MLRTGLYELGCRAWQCYLNIDVGRRQRRTS